MKNLSSALLSMCLAFGPASAGYAAGNAAAPTVAIQTVTLDVQNMDCPVCPFTVNKALEKVPGVSKVSVNFYAKTATVTFDPSKTNAQALARATGDAGFPSTVRK
ncbi:MAG TPA: mercury resistance system periplasmic binding protein MerP [Gammaproteobacteria bacterium]|jgi:mercuric ion binding protein|nr:mercury resistance system periplasmic binding protein MerP [Gammaproteobacteria bacterium]